MNFPPDYSNPEYPYYEEGMVMPVGMFSPMPDYTHEVLVNVACEAAYDFLIKNGVHEVLASETAFAMAAYINKAFEDDLVEYKIPEYFNRDIDKPGVRLDTLHRMAHDIPTVASTAVGVSLRGSPILDRGLTFYEELMTALRAALKGHLLMLIKQI